MQEVFEGSTERLHSASHHVLPQKAQPQICDERQCEEERAWHESEKSMKKKENSNELNVCLNFAVDLHSFSLGFPPQNNPPDVK